MAEIYVIPDFNNIKKSLELAEKWNLRYEYNDFYAPEMLDDRERQKERIRAYTGVGRDLSKDTLHGAFLDIVLHSTDPLIRQVSEKRVRQSMEIAMEMGLRGVVFHTGKLRGFREKNYTENWKKTNEEFYRKLLDDFPEQEVWIENMFDEEPDDLAKLAADMADCPRFGMCLDYAHAAIFGRNTGEWIRQLGSYIRHMHINDNDLIDDRHQAVGSGQIDWKEYDGLARQYGLEASVLIEVFGVEKQARSLEYMAENGVYPLKETGAPVLR